MSGAVCSVSTFAIDSGMYGGNQMLAGGALIERVIAWLKSLDVALPPKNEFLSIVDDAVKTYISPIDIPGIPNLVAEPMVDAMIERMIHNQASRLYDAFASQ